MLVIRRRPGETVVIGEDIEVEVLASSSSQVKLGIRAPRDINVVRQEIQLVEQQNRASVRKDAGQDLQRLLNSLQTSTENASKTLPQNR